jgi:hypothetical protein
MTSKVKVPVGVKSQKGGTSKKDPILLQEWAGVEHLSPKERSRWEQVPSIKMLCNNKKNKKINHAYHSVYVGL